MTPHQIKEGQYSDVMPEMSDEEFEALKHSIEEDGLRHPIEITEDGEIVDGHHRYKACRELDIDPETVVVEDATVEQAIRANFTRRNLSDGSKKQVVKDYLLDHWEGDRTQQEIAEDLGVDPATVSRAKQELEDAGQKLHRNHWTREEKRERVREYIERYPHAPDSEVALEVEADVSDSTVNNWRNEWASEDDAEADGDGSDDADSTDTGEDTDDVEPDTGEDSEPEETTAEEESEDTTGSGSSSEQQPDGDDEPTEDSASSTGETEPVSGDPADAEDRRVGKLVDRVAELEEKVEQKDNRIQTLKDGADEHSDKMQEKREEKFARVKPEEVKDVKQFVAKGLNRLPDTPTGENYLGTERVDEKIGDAEDALEDALGELEELV